MAGRIKLLLVFSLFGVAAALTILMWLRHEDAPPREVEMAELARRDGRMYLSDEAEPFTGFVIERYPSGELKSRSSIEQGVLHGISEGWYTNGVLQVREQFRNGVSHGVRTKWFEDGQKLSEAHIEEGEITGVFRRWHPNGTLSEAIEMANNQPNGLSRIYYASGDLKAEATMKNGVVVERKSWEEGKAPTAANDLVAK